MPRDNKVIDFKKPKNSISSNGDTIVESIIYNIDYSKSGKERAEAEGRVPNLFDGLAVKFAHIRYWNGSDERELIHYEKNDEGKVNVSFPCDVKLTDSEIDYCYITNEEYLNVSRVTSKYGLFGNYIKPTNEADLLVIYDDSLCSQLGIPAGTISDLILNLELTNLSDEELKTVGITKPQKKMYPIINVYRYRDSWVSKKDGKTTTKFMLTGYNRTEKKNDLGEVKWVDEVIGDSIYNALVDREIEKKNAANVVDVPF